MPVQKYLLLYFCCVEASARVHNSTHMTVYIYIYYVIPMWAFQCWFLKYFLQGISFTLNLVVLTLGLQYNILYIYIYNIRSVYNTIQNVIYKYYLKNVCMCNSKITHNRLSFKTRYNV